MPFGANRPGVRARSRPASPRHPSSTTANLFLLAARTLLSVCFTVEKKSSLKTFVATQKDACNTQPPSSPQISIFDLVFRFWLRCCSRHRILSTGWIKKKKAPGLIYLRGGNYDPMIYAQCAASQILYIGPYNMTEMKQKPGM